MTCQRLGLVPLVVLLCCAVHGQAQSPSIDNVPPVVVKTTPEAGSSEVDVTTTEIRVHFSKKMMTSRWSVVKVNEKSFPKINGKPRFEAGGRIFVLPVQLQAGQTYALWINAKDFVNFKDAGGRSAVPYLLVFKVR
ncbi:MAG: Ig-like domain-containing protein [Planctomycetota bacterium]|nr:Ig-like domain-containing protein [Planctomycetota bacterium]